ncbi:hypothetical protein GDO81_011740 [Engystomops pustulosus]|uniref:Uncharacterized protein n=1 Tax=Engystomops pustulosus TaxID=76066 RepID=A0AAV7BGP7_ENGPU|nr:hypothetical protein GDO81_011740 [Engystomops pustulosus]
MFRRRKNQAPEGIEVPGWSEAPYSILAQELGTSGLAEPWESKLKTCEPVDLVKTLEEVPVRSGDAVTPSSSTHTRGGPC